MLVQFEMELASSRCVSQCEIKSNTLFPNYQERYPTKHLLSVQSADIKKRGSGLLHVEDKTQHT